MCGGAIWLHVSNEAIGANLPYSCMWGKRGSRAYFNVLCAITGAVRAFCSRLSGTREE